MKKHVLALAAAAALGGAPMAAHALVYQFTAHLSGMHEVPPNMAPGDGLATLFYDSDEDTFDFSLAAFDLTGTAMMYHIHGPAGMDANAPVIVDLSGPGFLQLVGANSLLIGGNDIDTPNATFFDHLMAGMTYVNIHTAMYPAGELRGQLLPVAVIPEPATYALWLAGIAAVGSVVRRRRQPA